MTLKDFLRKKDKIDNVEPPQSPIVQANEFTFVRTDTHTEEYIKPPAFDDDGGRERSRESKTPPSSRPSFGRFRKSVSPGASDSCSPEKERKPELHRRLSKRLHFGRDRSVSTSSVNLPIDLPEIEDAYDGTGDQQEKEAKWEQRATILASKSPIIQAPKSPQVEMESLSLGAARHSPRPTGVNDPTSDVDIQEAIRLHEAGELEAATAMFRQLAQSGNVLSQVLYGLALRHGWGCQPDPEQAVTYLAAAATNSAEIESDALKAGMKKGGAAKGELVLAIFELANCFRNGWGVPVDKVAARQYYETAANLGDTDAMNEAAWCYLEGFGGKKDKVSLLVWFSLRILYRCSHVTHITLRCHSQYNST
jgi:hypothetical protein